jgi:hypothetical protein
MERRTFQETRQMKATVAAGLVLILAVSIAVGQTGADDRSGTTIRSRVPSTLRYLNERIEEVTFEEAPLDAVMDWLAGLTPMNVVVRWQILEDAGIERDKPISMNVRNLRLSQVLWMLMQEAGGSDLKLAYRASGELLIISTADDLGQEMVTRVYDVSDLLVRVQDFRSAPQLDISQASQGGQGGGSQNIFGGAGGSSRDDDDDDRGGRGTGENDEDMQELIDLIVQTIEPDSWADNGGLGTIQSFRNLLVVRNNILVHQALGGPVEEAELSGRQ